MKAVKATYKNGRVKLAETPPESGPVEVLVVFPEAEADPWDAILNETTPRPAFVEFVNKCIEEIDKGNTKPLDLDDL